LDKAKTIFCKNCNKKEEIKYNIKDQASIASCKKQYCSKACKKEYLKIHGTKNSVRLNCTHCSIKYFKPKSLSNSKFCSRQCQNTHQANKKKKKRLSKACKNCNKEFEKIYDSKQKYCSLECAADSKKSETKEFKCVICKCVKKIPIHDIRKYCGRDCQYKAQSLGLIKIPTNGRSGYRIDLPDDLYFKSSLEADYARYLIYHNIEFEYEKKCFSLKDSEGNTRRYTPDFFLKEAKCYVETKAKRKDCKYEKNLECVQLLKAEGYNIKVVYMKYFYKKLKEENEYDKIPNLERRNYKGTKHLVRNRGN
jgi:hypothetical protein|tara:strand:- start:107 stop:1030 length:924 start_codon:yes stop_codon:yes gene_type:complete